MQRGRAFGMIRFDDSLLELVRRRQDLEDVALRHAENKKELAATLRAAPRRRRHRRRRPAKKRLRLGGLFEKGGDR